MHQKSTIRKSITQQQTNKKKQLQLQNKTWMLPKRKLPTNIVYQDIVRSKEKYMKD